MSRNILEGMNVPEEEDDEKVDYKPPAEELVDSEMVSKLLEHHTEFGDDGKQAYWQEDSEYEVEILESMIKPSTDRLKSQPLIDTLTVILRDESENEDFTRTDFLTAVIQALYNLDCSNEFVVDIRNWPEDDYYVGVFLKGKPDRPLTLNLYGNFDIGGRYAEYCNFIIHDEAKTCGALSKHSNFTVYGKVEYCGLYARKCTFSLMPGAEMKNFDNSLLHENSIFSSNVLRRMNKDGEWEILFPPWLKWYHRIRSIFR